MFSTICISQFRQINYKQHGSLHGLASLLGLRLVRSQCQPSSEEFEQNGSGAISLEELGKQPIRFQLEVPFTVLVIWLFPMTKLFG
ncbi:hypothetical protein [Gloeocapsopsis sp. IPPAS B-1203]|uniref:hypothetical protein n=1 Tax=Gloeocapsopsis sp. IPPAS B-1203 TaxID=2049454 RepID=UPI000C1843F2|nr:hypothetical protein [Gloeocapsopsis sp. IPPAS B-1203]PIG93560.1 hypothetical protein CSQ79_11630 [Gloeocapsopsis sp. IPPAS B-1203]